MIRLFTAVEGHLTEIVRTPDEPIDLTGVVWIDLHAPTAVEEARLEELLGLGIPTRAEMGEIEASSRFYVEHGAVFMTANILSRPTRDMTQEAFDGRIAAMPVTFVLSGERLITVRYHEPRSFYIFQSGAAKGDMPCASGAHVLVGLLEVIVDRLADIAEDAGLGLDDIAARIFDSGLPRQAVSRRLDLVLERIGRSEDLNGKMAASLATLDRLVTALPALGIDAKKDLRARFKVLSRDLRSVSDHAEWQARRITFLLDSTLGKINIEQNGIIKIFSVMSVIFLPPTLIASIYGMNFEFMPELDNTYAYPVALLGMALSAVLPYLFFRRKGWL